MFMKPAKLRALLCFCLFALPLILIGCEHSGSDAARSSRIVVPKSNVAPQLANACEIAAANKYYLPRRVIRAYDATTTSDGGARVKVRVDLREAVCTVSRAGVIRSVVDVSPKSEDQLAAERAAAKGRPL